MSHRSHPPSPTPTPLPPSSHICSGNFRPDSPYWQGICPSDLASFPLGNPTTASASDIYMTLSEFISHFTTIIITRHAGSPHYGYPPGGKVVRVTGLWRGATGDNVDVIAESHRESAGNVGIEAGGGAGKGSARRLGNGGG